MEEPRPDPALRALPARAESLKDEIAERHRADATREVDEAVAFAEKSPYPEPHEALDHLFTEGEP